MGRGREEDRSDVTNIWHVFTRDVRRLLKVPMSWIIVIGMVVTPSLYAWVNIAAFWDPYGNTSKIDVAVVNLDEGGSSDLTGSLNIGDQIVEQMKENDQLGWRFTDLDDAQERVRSGTSYAAIVIPADFTQDLLTITTANFTQPQLDYYVNEKANPIAPKITDVGASTLQAKITQTFASAVGKIAAGAVQKAGTDAEDQISQAQQETLKALDDATSQISSSRASLDSVTTDLTTARSNLSTAASALADADTALAGTQSAIEQSQSLAAAAQKDLADFSSTATDAFVQGSTLLTGVSTQAQGSLDTAAEGIRGVNDKVGVAIDAVGEVESVNGKAIAAIGELIHDQNIDPDVKQQLQAIQNTLQERNTADQEVVDSLKSVNTDIGSTVDSLTDASSSLDSAMQSTTSTSTQLKTVLTQTIPALNQGMSALSGSAGGLDTAITSLRSELGQAQNLLAGLDTQLGDAVNALNGLGTTLGDIDTDLTGLRTDIAALSSAAVWKDLQSVTDLDPAKIGEFMASPVQVSEEVVFPVAAYGSAMAALFTNLSLWIGSFVLVVILKIEVDSEDIEGLTVRQGYLGRWLLMACLAALQGLLVTAGDLVLGVQHVNVAAFMATGVVIALTYLSIIYALSVSFSHIGRGLCVVLVIMQIPGASGLYPIEMMPSFFRHLYPFFPFTYGIDAMREVISGFYDGHYWYCLRILGVFVVLSFVVGLVLRRSLGNFTRLFNREIVSTDLLIAEQVHTHGRYRFSQVLRSLADRDEYRVHLDRRARTFRRLYPRLLRGALVAGIVVPIGLAVVPSTDSDSKALRLGISVLWFFVLVAFLVAVEYIRDSIEDGLELSSMADEDLRTAMSARYRARHGARPAVPSVAIGRTVAHFRASHSGAVATEDDPGGHGTPAHADIEPSLGDLLASQETTTEQQGEGEEK